MTTAENSWPSLSNQAESLCDEFEDRLKARELPRMEEYLERATVAERPALLYELLLVEWEYRQKRGEPHAANFYATRFAGAAHVVARAEEVFARRQRLNHAGPKGEATLRTITPDATAAHISSEREAPPAEPLVVGSVTVPRRLGDYELLEELGIGGMGIVFRARQRRAARIVALKLVRPDKLADLSAADRDAVLARFRQEAEAAARLQHDHAVTVYEVGCAEGFHYYSMRLVDGESLADLLQRGPLEPSAAAELLIGVAEATEEGHRLGIVHRDLKPRNILLEKKSGRALVTDFGLAKLLETDSELTRTGEVFGSPPYMAPEQAVSASTVTAAADTYALGATLYHALTGRPPFQAATVLQTLRQVVEEEPVSPRSLNRAVPRDLETICLKCLEKEPDRRYASAADLAAELRAFRAGEPIKARPLGRFDRAWRWCRRNPLSATLAAAAALLLCGVFVAVGVGYVTTAQALKREQAEREKAKENLHLAFRSVDLFFSNLSEDPRLKARGLETLRHELLTAATGFFELMVQQGNDPRISWERARAYGRLAHIGAELRERKEAAATYRQAVETLTQMEAAARATANATTEKGTDAGPTLTDIRELKALYLGRLGSLELELNETESAEKHLREAEKIGRTLANDDPQRFDGVFALAESRFRLAELHLWRGDIASAEEAYKETIALCDELNGAHPGRLEASELRGKSQTNLALLERRRNRLPEAIALSAAAQATYERLLKVAPENTAYVSLTALAEMNLGAYQRANKDYAAAETTLRAALARFETLVREHADVPDYRAKLAATQSNLASVLQDREKEEEAEPLYRQSMTTLGELVATFPEDAEYQAYLDAAWNNYGTLLEAKGNAAAAEEAYRHAGETFARLAALEPENRAHAARVAGAHLNHGRSLTRQSRWAEAAAVLHEAAKEWSALTVQEPKNVGYLDQGATAYVQLADSREELHALGPAEEAWRGAIRLRTALAELAAPELKTKRQNDLAATHGALAQLLHDQKKYEAAAAEWGEAVMQAGAEEAWRYRALAAVSAGMQGDSAAADESLAETREAEQKSYPSLTWLHIARAWSASAHAALLDDKIADDQREAEIKRRLERALAALDKTGAEEMLKDSDSRRSFNEDPALRTLRESPEFREWAKKRNLEP